MRRGSRFSGIVFALTIVGGTFSGAAADPLTPAPTTGTATGTYRTGLANAGLVSVEALGDASLWIGRNGNLSGAAARYDVQVELLNNGVPVASGIQRCIAGLGSAPTEIAVPWSTFSPPSVEAGDVLALRVSTRVGTNPGDTACLSKGNHSGLRLFYDSATSASHFGVEITPSPSVDLFLRSAASLAAEAPAPTPASFLDSADLRFSSGHAHPIHASENVPAPGSHHACLATANSA